MKYNISLIIAGSLVIVCGIILDNVMPWIDQINLTKIESCIADMHFRHQNETRFQECVTPDLKQIEVIQQLNAFTSILYSLGGVFLGLGIGLRKKSL